ncbi:restriction endonuclease subunit S [Actinomadura chokoriensis]|uniref:restriction endonuclease subunit S n=1 Tax=Actinomadura chokoriensis TaxID=454156 RepID=UPI0031F78262
MSESLVPSAWKKLALGDVLRRRTERADGSEPLLSVTQKRGVIPQDEVGRRDNSSEYKGSYWRVFPGDIVYNTMRMWQGVSGASDLSGIVSPAYTVCEPAESVNSRFLAYLFKRPGVINKFYRMSQGLVSDTWNLRYSAFALIEVALPPLEEQRRIVEVLAALDAQIECQRQVVEKFGAVVHGFSEEQLSLVTRSAKTARLDEVADIGSGVTLGGEVEGGIELPYLRVANVQDGYIDTSEMKTVRVARSEVARYRLEDGDVLLTEGGDIDKLGRGGVWDGRIDPCICQNHIFRVRCRRDVIRPEFMAAYAGSIEGKEYFFGIAKQTTNLATINSTQLKAMLVPLPSVAEQDKFIRLMEEVRGRLNAEVVMSEKLLSLKNGLAEDLLTGRVRVPEAEAVVESL